MAPQEGVHLYHVCRRSLFAAVKHMPNSCWSCSTSTKKERLQEYLAVEKVPDITDAEEREIDEAGSKVHHRVWVSRLLP